MRYVTLLLGAAMIFPMTAPAHAYCCSNEAICKAVCGSACCGANLKISRAAEPDKLGNFEIQDLMSTFNQAETARASRDFLRVLDTEIKRRR